MPKCLAQQKYEVVVCRIMVFVQSVGRYCIMECAKAAAMADGFLGKAYQMVN